MDLNSLISAFQEDQASKGRSSKLDAEANVSDLNHKSDPETIRQIESDVRSAIHTFQRTPKLVEAKLQNYADTRHHAEQAERMAQASSGHFRKAKKVDYLNTIAVMSPLVVAETGLTASSLVLDGTTDPIEGLAFASVFSIANAATGLLAGYSSRYVDYNVNAPVQNIYLRIKRRLASTACIVGLGIGALLNLTAGRVRAVASHEHIWDFENTPLSATFSDAIGISIMVVAGLSFVVSAYKGRNGLAEKRPELAEVADTHATDIDDETCDLVEDEQERLTDLHDELEEDIFSASPLPEDIAAADEAVAEHNALVAAAKNKVRIFAQEQFERACYVEGRDVGKPALDLSEFDALLIRRKTSAQVRFDHDLLEEMRSAYSEAMSEISQAHARYWASASGFRFLPPQSSFTK